MNKLSSFTQPQVVLEGLSLNSGIAQGVAYFYDPNFLDDANLTSEIRKSLFIEAVNRAIKSCSEHHISSEENKELILVQKFLLKDSYWHQRVYDCLDKGLCLTTALEEVLRDLENVFKTDQFWYTRFLEIRGITQLVRQNLSHNELSFNKDVPIVVCAKSISPVEIFQFVKAKLVAIVVEDKSFLSHGIILARSKGIPVVGGIDDLKNLINTNDELLVDGDLGRIYIKPPSSIITSYETKQKKTAPIKAINFNDTLQSSDGTHVNLYINASLDEDLEYLEIPFIKGVGLYRTEIPFMMHEYWPDVDTQVTLYKTLFEKSNGKIITFRTLDVGRDKTFYSLSKQRPTTNYGMRYDRLTMKRPALMRLQIRAIIRAYSESNCTHSSIKLMFPMISETQEMRMIRTLVETEIQRSKKLGLNIPPKILIGAMVEVPSLVFQLDTLLYLVDFISIGSNDLFQFTYAIDRTDGISSKRYDILSKPFLQLLKTIVEQAHSKGVEVSLCGEMASNPIEAMALLGIGLRNFSVNPNAINQIEKMVKSLNIWSMQDYMNDRLIDHPFVYKVSTSPIRQHIMELAKIQKTEIG